MVPVIVNAILDQHQLVVDIVAFVGKGDFPRSRLGEKQRGKILASWVTRKMRTIAQFGIRDTHGAGRDGGGIGGDFGGGISRTPSLMPKKPHRVQSFMSHLKDEKHLDTPTMTNDSSTPTLPLQFHPPPVELPAINTSEWIELPALCFDEPRPDLTAHTTHHIIHNPDLPVDPRLSIPPKNSRRQSTSGTSERTKAEEVEPRASLGGNINSVADFDWADGYHP